MTDEDDAATLAVLRTFLDEVHLAAPGDLPDVVASAAAVMGWTARLYVADHEQRVLVPLDGTVELPPAETLAIDGTLAGRCFRDVAPVPSHGEAPVLWVPLVDGIHRFGVIAFGLPPHVDPTSTGTHERARLLGHVTGHLFAAKAPYGDALQRQGRLRHRSIASELLWGLLPPLTFGCPGLVVSGILEPSYDVAADAFDYSVVDGVAHLAIFDATGHDLEGTLLAAVALAAYRNSRREGRTLYETVRAVDDMLESQWGGDMFATGVLGQLDLATGRLRYINAGHPAPLLMRGGRVVRELHGGRRIVLGFGDGRVDVAEEWLEPDDWLVLYTDGITEARDAHGEFYGLQRFTDQLQRSAAARLPAPETLRRVMHEVMDHQRGVLQDDASALVAQWSSGQERGMNDDVVDQPLPPSDPPGN